MQLIIFKGPRKDGKFNVRFNYEGGPNAFGGFYPGKSFNKLKTKEQINESLSSYTKPIADNNSIDFINHTLVKFED